MSGDKPGFGERLGRGIDNAAKTVAHRPVEAVKKLPTRAKDAAQAARDRVHPLQTLQNRVIEPTKSTASKIRDRLPQQNHETENIDKIIPIESPGGVGNDVFIEPSFRDEHGLPDSIRVYAKDSHPTDPNTSYAHLVKIKPDNTFLYVNTQPGEAYMGSAYDGLFVVQKTDDPEYNKPDNPNPGWKYEFVPKDQLQTGRPFGENDDTQPIPATQAQADRLTYDPQLTQRRKGVDINDDGITINASVAAAKGQLEGKQDYTTVRGKTKTKDLHEREAIDVSAAEVAQRRMRESADKLAAMEGSLWKKLTTPKAWSVMAERAWKGTLAERFAYIKEKKHAMDVIGHLGLTSGILPREFDQVLDEMAREKVQNRRTRWNQKLGGNLRDLGNEFIQRQSAFHRERIAAAAELRQRFDEGNLEANHPLFKLLTGEYQAQAYMADRIGDRVSEDFLHPSGETRTSFELPKDSAPAIFIRQNIVKPMINAHIDNTFDLRTEIQYREALQEYFLSPEFQDWRQQNAAASEAMGFSLTYATNLIDVLKGEMDNIVPAVNKAIEHGKTLDELDFKIQLTLGTVKYGPNGEVPARTRTEARSGQAERIFQKIKDRQRRDGGRRLHLVGDTVAHHGFTRDAMMAAAHTAAKNEPLWALVPYLATRGALSGARVAGVALGPLGQIASAAGGVGVLQALKESRRLSWMRSEVDRGAAVGEVWGANAKRHAEIAQFDYQKVDMVQRSRDLTDAIAGINDQSSPEDRKRAFLNLVGLTGDTYARVRLGDRRNINLLKVGTAAETSPMVGAQLYQAHMYELDQARVAAKGALEQALTGAQSAEYMTMIRDAFGPEAAQDATTALNAIVQAHEQQLQNDVKLPEDYARFLDASLVVAEGKHTTAVDKAFRRWKMKTAAKHGARVAIGSLVGGTVGKEAYAIISEVKSPIVGPTLDKISLSPARLREMVVGRRVEASGPLLPMNSTEVVHNGHVMQLSSNLRMDGDDLVVRLDGGGQKTLIDNFTSSRYVNADNTLTTEGLKKLQEYHISPGNTDYNAVVGSHPLTIGTQQVMVPNGSGWHADGTDNFDFRITVHNNVTGLNEEVTLIDNVKFTGGQPADPNAVIDRLKHNSLLSFAEGRGATPFSTMDSGISGIDAMIPAGTQLVPDGSGAYNLVTTDTSRTIIGSSFRFDTATGQMVHGSRSIDIGNYHLRISETSGTGTTGGTFDMSLGGMGSEGGRRGPWSWLEDPIYAPASGIDHQNPSTNLMKNLFKGWQENYRSDNSNVTGANVPTLPNGELHWNTMRADVTFHEIPNSLFSDAKIKDISQFMDRSIDLVESHPRGSDRAAFLTSLESSSNPEDRLTAMAYHIGREGRIADRNEVQAFMDHFGGSGSKYGYNFQLTMDTPVVSFNGADVLTLQAPELTEVTASNSSQFGTPWVIPLGWTRPLEEEERSTNELSPLNQSDQLTPYPEVKYPYGIDISTSAEALGITPDEIKKTMSPKFLENPEYIPDPDYEINRYLEQQKKDNPEYWALLENLDQQVKTPMHDDCVGVVSLAVAGHQEHDNIYRTLQTYGIQQKKDGASVWDTQKFEINLLVNWPAGADANRTFSEIQRFRMDHPEVPLNIYTHVVTNGKKELGLYKKMIFDLALLRSAHRTGTTKDVAVIMNDADMTYSHPRYLTNMVDMFENPEYTTFDAILGRQDLDAETYDKYPTFHAGMTFWHIMEAIARSKKQATITQGRNTLMRASSYAAIGGNRTKEFWADIELGVLLKKARNGKNSIAYSNAGWVMVDPRRELSKFLSGEPLGATWFDFNTNEVRGVKIDIGNYTDVDVNDLANANPDSTTVHQFENRLKKDIDSILYAFGGEIDDEQLLHDYSINVLKENHTLSSKDIIERSLRMMGVVATVVRSADGHMQVSFTQQTDSSGALIASGTEQLRQDLLRYHQNESWKTKVKSHPLFTE